MRESNPGIGNASKAPAEASEWLVVGVGSPAGSDDAIGLDLVRGLAREAAFAARCVLLESADALLVASYLLEWQRPAVFVDAADMRLAPGQYRFFPDSAASLTLKASSVSTHGLGLADGLDLARALGYDRPVRIFGVQPFDLSPKQGLTDEMSARFPSLLAALKEACFRLPQ